MTEQQAAAAPAAAPVAPGAARRRTLAEQEMVDSLGWLVAMRWLAGLGVMAGTLVAGQLLSLPVNEVALYRLGLAILAYNAALRWWLERIERQPESTVAWERFGRAQIFFDWLAMTVLTSLSGGVESPAIIFFLFHVSIAALLLPHARGLSPRHDRAAAGRGRRRPRVRRPRSPRLHLLAAALSRSGLRPHRLVLLRRRLLRARVFLHGDRPPPASSRERGVRAL